MNKYLISICLGAASLSMCYTAYAQALTCKDLSGTWQGSISGYPSVTLKIDNSYDPVYDSASLSFIKDATHKDGTGMLDGRCTASASQVKASYRDTTFGVEIDVIMNSTKFITFTATLPYWSGLKGTLSKT